MACSFSIGDKDNVEIILKVSVHWEELVDDKMLRIRAQDLHKHKDYISRYFINEERKETS